jgi:hypothetical protein
MCLAGMFRTEFSFVESWIFDEMEQDIVVTCRGDAGGARFRSGGIRAESYLEPAADYFIDL